MCAPERLDAVATELEADAARRGERVLFFGAGERLEQVYAARRDHCLVPLGAQPVWEPAAWPAIVRGKASLRAQLNRARNKGVRVDEWPAARARELVRAACRARRWLRTRGLPPLGFHRRRRTCWTISTTAASSSPSAERSVVAFLIGDAGAGARRLAGRAVAATRAPRRTARRTRSSTRRCAPSRTRARSYVTLGLAPLAERAGPIWRASSRRGFARTLALDARAWTPVLQLPRARGVQGEPRADALGAGVRRGSRYARHRRATSAPSPECSAAGLRSDCSRARSVPPRRVEVSRAGETLRRAV